jgi:hypothetical protein
MENLEFKDGPGKVGQTLFQKENTNKRGGGMALMVECTKVWNRTPKVCKEKNEVLTCYDMVEL